MILKQVHVERYGCFGTAEFEFRRGLNLVSGSNESGKSLLLSALPAALLGIEHGSRLRSWGDTLSCRVTLWFEGKAASMRLVRDLESNLVRIEEGGADGAWRECFAGIVPLAGPSSSRDDYFRHLERLLGIGREPVLRALLVPGESTALLLDNGCLAAGPAGAPAGAEPVEAVDATLTSEVQRQAEIAGLEAGLAVDRDEYRKGEQYLQWVRKRWQREGGKTQGASGSGARSTGFNSAAPLTRQKEALLAEMKEQGLPARLPADLPALFERAEALRQELAALQLELAPLQRNLQGVVRPRISWPLLVTLVAGVATGGAFWLKSPWLLPLTGGGAALLLLSWTIFLVRLMSTRGRRGSLEQEIQGVEAKKSAALGRQAELAEQFESYGLPSTPVEMVKLQQLCRRNEELIRSYQELSTRLGEETAAPLRVDRPGGGDQHLRPEELPEAEARLAALGESIRQRESQLQALRSGTATPVGSQSPAPVQNQWSEMDLLKAAAVQLERLTAGRYTEIRLTDRQLRLEAAPGRWAVAAACGRGTQECLDLALRLALAEFSANRVPLTVDELPAFLDMKRRQTVLRTLERHAVSHQLLLASCDEDLARRAHREHWPMINLNVTVVSRAAANKEATDGGQLHLL